MTQLTDDSVLITGCGWVTPFAAGTIRDCLQAAPSTPPNGVGDEGFWAVPEEMRNTCPDLTNELKRDRGAWVTAVAFEKALADAGVDKAKLDANSFGLVLGCALAGQLGMIAFASEVRDQSPRFVSPIHFPQTVGNYVAGALARAYNICGPNITIASGSASGLEALIQACGLLQSKQADLIVAGGAETLTKEMAAGFSEPGTTLSEGACLFVLERAASAAARGASELARITGFEAVAGDQRAATVGADTVFSTGGAPVPGAIVIEHSIGRCFAALGAAVVAAGIGALAGLPVPHTPSGETTAVESAPLPGQAESGSGSSAAVCVAEDDRGQCKTLRLAAPGGSAS